MLGGLNPCSGEAASGGFAGGLWMMLLGGGGVGGLWMMLLGGGGVGRP